MKTYLIHRVRLAVMVFLWTLVQSATAQDFTMTLQPDSVTLVPGQTASFVISSTPLDGFTNNVTLSVDTLPSGVTATFSPNPLKPPGTSVLTLSATPDAAVGSFTLNLTGTSGGITHTTTSSVTVNFGLLPTCTGGFTGEVTDLDTGLPITNANLTASFLNTFFASVDASGTYNFTNLPLANNNNAAADYGLRASAPKYWPSPTVFAFAICDATNTQNFQLVLQQFGSISGNVSIQGGGPLAGVAVFADGQADLIATTDANGNYTITNVLLSPTNAPATYTVFTSQTATNWQAQSNNILVQANSNNVVNLVVVPICTGGITGGVVDTNTSLPITNAIVQIAGGANFLGTNVDQNGNYAINGITLRLNNAPLTTVATASAIGYFSASVPVTLDTCGQVVALPLFRLTPVPQNNFGAVQGHVFDVQTGLPITNANIDSFQATDATGAYLLTNILVGNGPTTNALTGISASAPNYFSVFSNVMVFANQTNTQDFQLLRIGFGGVQGTVRDSATTLPLTNIFVTISGLGSVLTDTNGHYFSGPVPLTQGNVPTAESIFTSPPGYYGLNVNTTITNGITNVVDLNPIKVCTGATIVGNVVNALTQQPITNATIFVSGFPSQITDTNGNFILTNITVGNNNSPSMVTVNASAPGFNPQSHNVTIFCNATIITQFGAPQTAFGVIQGVVTNVVTGAPLAGVFIGSEFGEATTTDTNGFYELTQAPLGANNSSRNWTVTAIPTNFPPQTLPVTAFPDAVSTLNFGFGEPPTHLLVTETSAPDPVTVGSNLVYTITLLNSGADAANVQLNDQLAPNFTFGSAAITNPPGGSFTTPVFSNGVVTTTATNLAANQSLVLIVSGVPTVSGPLTNITTVTSSTPDTDPTGTNLTAMVINTADAPEVQPFADLVMTVTAQPNPVLVGNQLTYTLSVLNSGPADAPDVALDDTLPPNTTFVSASNSQGSFTQNGSSLHWDLGEIANQATATATFIVTPQAAGPVTNSATATLRFEEGATITDPNTDNNTASVVTTVNAPVLGNVSVQPLGPITFNPQTGLFEQTIQFNNLNETAATAVRVSILGLPASVTLYNASGSANGSPFVEFDQTVPAGGTVNFALEYYSTTRLPFVSTNFSATAVEATTPTQPPGSILQLDQTPTLHNGQLLIEFISTPGTTYAIQFSSDMETWKTAVPPIVAAGTKVQWIDSGPPKTDSPPGAVGQRFYRVVQIGGVVNARN